MLVFLCSLYCLCCLIWTPTSVHSLYKNMQGAILLFSDKQMYLSFGFFVCVDFAFDIESWLYSPRVSQFLYLCSWCSGFSVCYSCSLLMEDLDYIQFKLEHGRVSLLRLWCVSKHPGVKISFSFRSKFQTKMYLSLNIVLSTQTSCPRFQKQSKLFFYWLL